MGDVMRKMIMIVISFLMISGCTIKEPIFKNKESLKIAVATDLHYFAKEYYEQCEWFEEQMLYGDGKMVTYADEIINAFIDDVIEKKVDLVLLTGDLTFNGEVNSHKSLALLLNRLEENGIQVAVIAGNHDIDNIFTKGYGKDDYFDVGNISANEFRDIYKDLGYDIAVSTHKDSLSYEIVLNDKYSLLVVDSNTHELTTGSALDNGGYISDSTKKWLIDRFDHCKKSDLIPIVAMHHNLGVHNEVLNNGYTIYDNSTYIDMFKEYNVPLVLSGHIHLQSILDVEGIKEITTTSLLVNPLQYGLIELSFDNIVYNAVQLLISEDSAKYFDTVSLNKFYNEDNSEEAKLKREVIKLVNRHYFAGTINEIEEDVKNMKGYSLIMNENDGFSKSYLESMLKSNGNNINVEIPLKTSY